MSKKRILVVEDEIIIADNICYTLEELGYEELGYEALEPAMNYTEAIEIIEKEKPDLAILDIQLSGGKTGIDLAKIVKEEYSFPFIFLTSNADAATISEAKKARPSAYLVKPFSKEELHSSIEVALYNFSKEVKEKENEDIIVKDALFLKEKGIFHKLNFDDILYLKSAHIYVEIFQKGKKKIVVRGSLNEIIPKLSKSFIRVHRGYVINTKYLMQIDTNSLKIEDEIIPVGKKYQQNLLRKINFI